MIHCICQPVFLGSSTISAPVILRSWKNSKNITTKLQVVINKSLRKILKIFWQDQITNKELWKHTKQPRIHLQIRRRKWRWLGCALQKQHSQANPRVEPPRQTGQGGRPRNSWWRTVLKDDKGVNTLRTGLLNCLNARSRGLTFRHRASCI